MIDAITQSPHKEFVVGLALVPFTVAEGGGAALFQGGKAALRHVLKTSRIEGVSGAQGLSLLRRLKKGPVDDVVITAGEEGTIRATFSRTIDDITEVTTRTYDRGGEQIGVKIRRYNKDGKEVY